MRKFLVLFFVVGLTLSFSCSDSELTPKQQLKVVTLENGFQFEADANGRPSFITDEDLKQADEEFQSRQAGREQTCSNTDEFGIAWGDLVPYNPITAPNPTAYASSGVTAKGLVKSDLWAGPPPSPPNRCFEFHFNEQSSGSPNYIPRNTQFGFSISFNTYAVSGTFAYSWSSPEFVYLGSGQLAGGTDIKAYTFSYLGSSYYYYYAVPLIEGIFTNYDASDYVLSSSIITATTCGGSSCPSPSLDEINVRSGKWDITSVSPTSVVHNGSVTVTVTYNLTGCPTCTPTASGTVTVGSTNANQNQRRLNPVSFTVVPGTKTYTVSSTAYKPNGSATTVPVGVTAIPYGEIGSTINLTIN